VNFLFHSLVTLLPTATDSQLRRYIQFQGNEDTLKLKGGFGSLLGGATWKEWGGDLGEKRRSVAGVGR